MLGMKALMVVNSTKKVSITTEFYTREGLAWVGGEKGDVNPSKKRKQLRVFSNIFKQ